MSTGVRDNATNTQSLTNMNDFTNPLSTMNDTFAGDYNTFNTSLLPQITPPESDANVQYTYFDNDSFDVNEDPPAF